MNVLPLLANDWLQSLGPLILVVFWVLRQVLVAKGEEAEAEAKRPPRPARDPGEEGAAVRGEAVAAPAGGDDAQRAEVEEFLRRVGRLGDEPAPEAPADDVDEPPAPRRRVQDPFEEPRRRAPAPVAARGAGEIELLIDDEVEAADVPARATAKPVGGLAEKHLPESQLAEQAAHLGERIASADERFESRLQDKFEHRLGRLRERQLPEAAKPAVAEATSSPESASPAASTESTPAAKRVAEMLARPDGVRDAVVLSEILRRPSDPFGPRSAT